MSQPARRLARRTDPYLNPIQLVELTRLLAGALSPRGFTFDAHHRWHQRLYRDALVDVWLLTWLPGQGTELHDHGGSRGAFTVISGDLSEAVYRHTGANAGTIQERVHPRGRSVGFDSGHVHDVRNLAGSPAVSVHAYSSPLHAMSYFDVVSGGLRRTRTVETDEPESGSGSYDPVPTAAAVRVLATWRASVR